MFSTLLEQAGLTQTAFADLIDVQPGTVYSWKGEAPGYAIAYLHLYIDNKECREFQKAMQSFSNA